MINMEGDVARKKALCVVERVQRKYYEKDGKLRKCEDVPNVAVVDVELVVSGAVFVLVAKILENQKKREEKIVNTNVVVVMSMGEIVLYQLIQ